MRISDWSSDVCSSDLLLPAVERALLVGDGADGALAQLSREHAVDRRRAQHLITVLEPLSNDRVLDDKGEVPALAHAFAEAKRRHVAWESSEERRVGKECVSPCSLRCAASN